MGLKSQPIFKWFAARPKAMKDKGKGNIKSYPRAVPQAGVSNVASVGVVLGSEASANALCAAGLIRQHHLQPMRQSKLWRITVVDDHIDHQLVFSLGTSNSKSISSRNIGCGSNKKNKDNLSNDDSDEGDVHTHRLNSKCRRF